MDLGLPPPGWLVGSEPIHGAFIIRTDGIGKRALLEGVFYPEGVSVSPAGDWIAFTGMLNREDPIHHLFLVRPDGSDLRSIYSTDGYINTISWSPDGKNVVFALVTGPRGQTQVDLYEVELGTNQVVQLTNTRDLNEQGPVYLSDGEVITFLLHDPGQEPQSFVPMMMDIDGTDIRSFELLQTSDWISYAWSPAGTELVYSSGGDQKCGNNLYLIDKAGDDLRRLTKSADQDGSPTWSPDSEWVAFSRASCSDSGVTGFDEIFILHRTGGGLLQVSDQANLTITGLAWLPFPALTSGLSYMVTDLGQGLNLRETPSVTGAVIYQLSAGESISVIDGPVEADDYLWWQIMVGDEEGGWIAELPGWFSTD